MRLARILGRAAIGLAALAAAACAPEREIGAAPETRPVRAVAEQRQGDQVHPQIVAHFGGAYEDVRLAAYVNEIGQRVARVSEQPNARWTFTVLDNPTINAFAIPGGYVYVTRGLVALAGDEAQLAGVLGHEIGHVTAGHSALRERRSTMASLGVLASVIGLGALGVDPEVAMNLGQAAAGGILASHSRAAELEADDLGILYLARAGYDPAAQAEFLDRLRAWETLAARISGEGYDPNRVDFFASHPATGLRTQRAMEVARAAGIDLTGAERNRPRFLAAIDGMVWGDSAEQGFVDGRTFSHPVLGFTFTVPQGFTIRNSADAVTVAGPRNSRFIFDGAPEPRGPLTDYIAGQWAPAIARNFRTGQLSGLSARTVNGLEAASAVLPVALNNQAYDALLVAYRLGDRVYRVTGLAPQGSGLLGALADAAETFRRLSPAEIARLEEKRIHVVTVQPGDTLQSLARRVDVDGYHAERFRVLNGLTGGETLRPGDQVKIVR